MPRPRVGFIEGFPERFKKLIAESGYSMIEIAQKVGRDRKALYGYLHGDSSPDAVVIVKLCEVLKTTPNYLLLGKE